MSIDKAQRFFLLAMGIGLVPIALTYGAVPETSLPWLYGLSDPDLPTRHLLRAVMGLYLGMIVFWLTGAMRAELRIPALWSVFVFVTGIALGRVLSLVLDGWPQPIFVFYLLAEIVLAGTSWVLITKAPSSNNAGNG